MKPIPYLLGRIKRGFVPALVFLGQVPYLLILLTLDQIGFSQEVFVCLFVYLLIYCIFTFQVLREWMSRAVKQRTSLLERLEQARELNEDLKFRVSLELFLILYSRSGCSLSGVSV